MMKIRCLPGLLALAAMSLLSDLGCAATWTASVDDRNGLPLVSKGGAAAVTSDFVFWGKDWQWAGPSTHFKIDAPFQYEVTGESAPLNLHLSGRVGKSSSRELRWTFDLDAGSALLDVIGGGFSFRFDLGSLGAELGEPVLLPDNRGWSWGRAGGARLQLQFDPPLENVAFEMGRKSEIRAYFYSRAVQEGHRHYTATLEVSDSVAIGATATERFGPEDLSRWPQDVHDIGHAPIDVSFLNEPERPAGKHGFLKAVQDKLEFQDGTPMRFWGTNVTAYSLFSTSANNVKRQARRLSELGFNLVRLHHHDSSWVGPNIFGNPNGLDTRSLSAAMLEKLDWWIKCLKDEGIYVWLDLHVGRQLTERDGIEDFNEISRGKRTADLRGYNYINPSIQKAMQEFNEAYVSHHNTFTGLAYKEEPAIIAMLITNENDLTAHFGNALLPVNNLPNSRHGALYMALADAFAIDHGLPKEQTWRSWEHGPSKLFLSDLQHRFDAGAIQALHELGVKAPLVTTSSWGEEPLSSLPALTAGDLIDVHSYGKVGELERNPLHAANFVDWIAAAHVAGHPLAVTEWNMGSFLAPDRHATPLYIAGSASFQGWDALMQFAYSQGPLNDRGGPNVWQSFNDPSLLATLPAAALLFRRHDVKEARTAYVFAPTQEQLFGKLISPANSVALRSATEKGKLVIAMPSTKELPWLVKSEAPPGANIITDPNKSVIDPDASEAQSDTGELRRNWDQGIYTIDTPRTQAAMGWVGGKRIALADVEISLETRNATVAVQSLDGDNIRTSRSLMISLGARAAPEAGNRVPFHMEPVLGRLIIHAPEGLRLYGTKKKADPQGASPASQENPFPAPFRDDGYHISLEDVTPGYALYLRQ